MVFDHEMAWLDLKAHVRSKRSHGEDELLRVMTDMELKYRVEEDSRGISDLPLETGRHVLPADGLPDRLRAVSGDS